MTPTERSTFDTGLDEILIKFGAYPADDSIDADETKQAIKTLILSEVIGEDVDINEIRIARIKNIKGNRKGADVKAFDWSIEVETWKNQLRAEQRGIVEGKK